jgi:hypothetical protein
MAERVVRERHVFGPVRLARALRFTRADLEVYRINTFRPSFVAHVFFNDTEADVNIVDRSADVRERSTYAGRFAVFGHERCVGDDGHCDVPTASRRFDDRPSHPLTPAFRRVVVTEALRRVLADSDELTITIIATATASPGTELHEPLFDAAGVQLATFA